MQFIKIFLMIFIFMKSESFIIGSEGLEKEINRHPTYNLLKKNNDFQNANLVISIMIDPQFIKHPSRPSRNVFGYTKFILIIHQNEKLIYKKTFRLSCFDTCKRNLVSYNEKKSFENNKAIIDYMFNVLSLIELSDSKKISKNLKKIKIKEPTSNLILFYENGKIKAFNLNFKDFSSVLKVKEELNVIPFILNKHEIRLIKTERIYNHGIYSYLTIENVVIKLPNKNYFENLYKTLLKIEIIYLSDKNIFNKDSSVFFTEFDKLASKTTEELIKTKETYKKNKRNFY